MLKLMCYQRTCRSVILYLVGFTLCLSVVQCNVYKEFLNFISTYGKTYKEGSQEFKQRFLNFQENRRIQEQLNKAQDKRTAVYGVTKFSDLSFKEFQDLYLSSYKPKIYQYVWNNYTETPQSKLQKLNRPPKLDWRTENNHSIITPIKDQAKCGGCWAFCTVECIESVYANKTQQPPKELSVQEVLDCDTFDGGCAGGDICTALQWMTLNKVKLVSESEYPLKDVTGTCKVKPQTGVQVRSHECYNGKASLVGHEDVILDLLYTKGPVAVAVDAKTWYNYQGGIIQYHCEADNNHAVQIVGYDTTGDVPYYIVRNSWGNDFGDKGYLYIGIGKNLCGIAKEVATVDVYI